MCVAREDRALPSSFHVGLRRCIIRAEEVAERAQSAYQVLFSVALLDMNQLSPRCPLHCSCRACASDLFGFSSLRTVRIARGANRKSPNPSIERRAVSCGPWRGCGPRDLCSTRPGPGSCLSRLLDLISRTSFCSIQNALLDLRAWYVSQALYFDMTAKLFC